MFKNILVPTDGSAPSRRAIKRAVQLAKEQRARVIGFYVGPPWQLPVYSEYVPPSEVARYDERNSLGMVNMHERAELVGGALTISSAPGEGTRVRLSVPLQRR